MVVVVAVEAVVVGKERIPRQKGWKMQERRRDETTTVKRRGSIVGRRNKNFKRWVKEEKEYAF